MSRTLHKILTDGEAAVLEIFGVLCASSLPLLSGPTFFIFSFLIFSIYFTFHLILLFSSQNIIDLISPFEATNSTSFLSYYFNFSNLSLSFLSHYIYLSIYLSILIDSLYL